MDFLKLIYRGKEYTFEEWNDTRAKFEQQLELPRMEPGLKEFSPLYDEGYTIAIVKLEELYHLIASARYALINAHEKLHDSNIIRWQGGYEGQLWYRVQQLKNSIIWYNSCEDYLCQALWFGYGMCEKKISSKKDFLIMLKDVNYIKVKGKLKSLKGTEFENNANLLLSRMEKYHEDLREIREKYANNLKHRGNLYFSGLDSTRLMSFTEKDKDGGVIFDTEWIEPDMIDIDETINSMVSIHKQTVDYARFIVEFMDINNVFVYDEDGNVIMGKRKNKRNLKKLLFE